MKLVWISDGPQLAHHPSSIVTWNLFALDVLPTVVVVVLARTQPISSFETNQQQLTWNINRKENLKTEPTKTINKRWQKGDENIEQDIMLHI